jgi:hypothetical protein
MLADGGMQVFRKKTCMSPILFGSKVARGEF